jgi:uncharacterized protein (DUF1015 family)
VRVYPFAALRPAAGYASQVAAPPYDVLSSDEARVLVGGNGYSFLHVDKAEIDLPEDTGVHDAAVYAKAGENLRRMADTGVLIQEAVSAFYIYRLTMNGRSQTGLACCVDAADNETGIVKKHEFTRPDKEQDRVDHVLACSAHTGPIFMAYKSNAQLTDEMRSWCENNAPVYDFVSEDGVGHTVWVVDDAAAVRAIEAAAETVPCIYIADGHHRSAAAVRVSKMVDRDEAGRYLTVMFPQDELEILDYNRVVKDLNGLTAEGFIKTISVSFDVTPSEAPVKPAATYEYGLYTEGRWYRLTYKHAAPDDAVSALAVSVLQDKVLSPVLGIHDPRSDKRIDFVGGARGVAGLTERVDSGEMAAAFTLSATKMDELLNVADAGQVMPPKSTWFEPKLRSGLLIHKF